MSAPASRRSLQVAGQPAIRPVATQSVAQEKVQPPVCDAMPELPPIPTAPTTLFNVNSYETLVLDLPADGHLDRQTRRVASRFFRCKRTKRQHAMHLDVLALLADISSHYPGHVIEIVSGYRRRHAVPHSKHRIARAIDLRVRDVSVAELRDYLWRTHRHVGVGYYREQRFVHMDVRKTDTAWTQRWNGARYRYSPKWADVTRAGVRAELWLADRVVSKSIPKIRLRSIGTCQHPTWFDAATARASNRRLAQLVTGELLVGSRFRKSSEGTFGLDLGGEDLHVDQFADL